MVMEIIISVVLLFVGIAILVIIHICVVGRAFRRGFLSQEDEHNEEGIMYRARSSISCGLSVEDLKRIPWFEYKGEEKESSCVDCAVCLEGFKAGDRCRLLPSCQHCFHLQCVDIWLTKMPVCPICRASARPSKKSVVGDELV